MKKYWIAHMRYPQRICAPFNDIKIFKSLIFITYQYYVKNDALILFNMIRITIAGFSRVQTQLIDAKTQVFVKNEKILASAYALSVAHMCYPWIAHMRSRPDCLKKIVFQNLRYLTVSTLAFVCKSIENRDVGLCIEK